MSYAKFPSRHSVALPSLRALARAALVSALPLVPLAMSVSPALAAAPLEETRVSQLLGQAQRRIAEGPDAGRIAPIYGGRLAKYGGTLTVAPGSIQFPNTPTDSSSPLQAFTVSAAVANIVVYNFFEYGGSEFVRTGGTCPASNFMLYAGTSCTVGFTYQPTTALFNGYPDQKDVVVSTDSGTATVELRVPVTLDVSGIGFSPAPIDFGGVSTLSINFNNANYATHIQSASFTLNYPAGLVNAATPNVTATAGCNYTNLADTLAKASLAKNAVTAATPGGGTLQVTNMGILARDNCTITVDVTSSTPAEYTVALAPGDVVHSYGANTTGKSSILLVKPPALSATLTPTSMSFPATEVDYISASQQLTLTNTGTGPLAISSITSTGPYMFQAGTTCAVGTPVPIGGSCAIDVSFAPITVGTVFGTVVVTTDGGVKSANLTGTGTPGPMPVISTSPSSVAFGFTDVGTTTLPQYVVVGNAGQVDMDITQLSVEGPFSVQFCTSCLEGLPPPPIEGKPPVPACPLPPFYLGVEWSCYFTVTFSPVAAGQAAGSVTIQGESYSEQELDVSPTALPPPVTPYHLGLSGIGGSPVALRKTISIAPDSLNFGPIVITNTSAPQSFTIANSGGASVSISGVTLGEPTLAPPVAGKVGNPQDFTLTHNCGTLSPLGDAGVNSCSGTVTFRPSAVGTRIADVRVAGDFEGSPSSVQLEGTGSPPPFAALTLSATNLGFGQLAFGKVSPAQVVTVTNNGGLPAAISRIYAVGDFHQTNSCPASLAPNQTCSVSVTFGPSLPGSRSGSLVIESNATNGPHQVELSGSVCRLFSIAGSRFGTASCGS